MDGEVPAAAQISQADIIERQAQTIARLQRQVDKGAEYKRLTKSKLKEAAARLREYRVRVETLLADQKKDQKKTQTRNGATQTDPKKGVTRACQTKLTGPVQRVNRKIQVDAGVQTVDPLTSRKRGREMSTQTEVDQLIPKLSRDVGRSVDSMNDIWTPQEPLQMLGDVDGGQTAFLQATSAALDAELAFSDSEDGTRDTLELDSGQETEDVAKSGDGAAGPALGFDQSVLNEIDKGLESSDEEAVTRNSSAASGQKVAVDAVAQKAIDNGQGAGVSLLGGLDQSVLNEIDEELATSSDEEDDGRGKGSSDVRRHKSGAESADKVLVDVVGGLPSQVENGNGDLGPTADIPRLSGLDATVSNAIDKELETSSDEEDTNRDAATATDAIKSHRKASESNARVEDQRTLMSIADELDNELAALSSSSSSSDSDSSDSSDSDSDDGDDPMKVNADKNEVIVAVDEAAVEVSKNKRETDSPSVPTANSHRETLSPSSIEPDSTKEVAESTAQQSVDNGERRASTSSSTDKDAVVITTPVQKKPVTAVEEMYSPVVAPDVPLSTPEPLRLEASAASTNRSADKDQSTVVVGSQENSAHVQVPETTQITKTAGAASTFNASQSRSDEIRASTTPPLDTGAKSRIADRSADSEVSTMKSVKQASIVSSRDSVLSMTGPENPERDNEVLPSRGVLESASLGGDRVIIGKPRKADEANLADSTATAPKKIKRDEVAVEERPDDAMPYTSLIAGSKPVKKKSATKVETKDEMRMKKSLAAFKQAIVLDKGEEASNEYARRTIAFLVNQSAKFIDTHLAHVTKLCHTLANAYRKLEITPMMAVRGALGVFRTPRSRRLMARNKQDLSWLCNQLLIMLMSGTDETQKQDESLCLSPADECLQHLRGFLVEERKHIGDSLSASRVEMQVSTPQVNVSHDKVFLAHICALHTHLCKSTGQLTRSRVLLFELLRDHPNIRGLYFAMTMLEIYPAILEREFDEHCMEHQVILKETLQQVVVAIADVAAERHELLLHQSSITMLHNIAEAIQMPELEEVDGSNSRFSRSCVEKLVEQLTASCHPAAPQDQTNAESFTKSITYFELAKSLELCTAVFGLDLVTQILSIERCRELFVHANAEAKSGLLLVVSHIAMAIAPKTSNAQSPRTRSEDYVDGVLDWLYHILSTEADDDKTTPDDRFKVLLGCSTVCIELILEYSASAGLDTRRRVLCAVVKWFDAMPSDRLFHLPATFLRRLRLAVVAARPQVAPVR